MKFSKKKIGFGLVCVCTLLLVFFWNPLVSLSFEWGLKRYCRTCLGGDLHAVSIKKKDNTWVIEKPMVLNPKNNLPVLNAEKITIKYHLAPKKQKILFDVHVHNPVVQLDRLGLDDGFNSFIQNGQQKKSISFFETSLFVDDGVVSWGDQSAGFKIEPARSGSKKEAKIWVQLDKRKTENCFEVELASEDGYKGTLHFDFHQVEAAPVFKFSEACGLDLGGFNVHGGQIDGKVSVLFPLEGGVRLEGNSTFKEIAFQSFSKEIQGFVKEAKLQLKRHAKKQSKITGSFKFTDEASLQFYKKGVLIWEIDQMKGGLDFEEPHIAHVNFAGQCMHNEREFSMHIDGHAHFLDESQAFVDLACRALSQDKGESSVHFLAKKLGAGKNIAEIQIKNLGHEEFAFVKEVVERKFPEWKNVHVTAGRIDAAGVVSLEKYRVNKVQLDELKVNHLVFDARPWVISGKIGQSSGKMSFDLAALDPLESINANFSVSSGEISVLGLGDKRWDFTGINTEIAVANGVVQKSVLFGEFSGLAGEVTLDWATPNELISFDFSGGIPKIIELFPEMIKERAQHAFSKDQLSLSGKVKEMPMGAGVNGSFIITDPESKITDQIDFAFQLEKASQKLWKSWPAKPEVKSYWEKLGLEVLQKSLPAFCAPIAITEANLMRRESGIAGFVMRNGTFEARDLPVKKYVSSFLFAGSAMTLDGRGDFHGFFDHKRLDVTYTGKKISLENDHFRMNAEKLGERSQNKSMCGAHYFDFDRGVHYGTLPLEKTSYFDKSSGFAFPEIDGMVTFESDKIHLKISDARCSCLCAKGSVDINLAGNEKPLEIAVRMDAIEGKISDLEKLAAQFGGLDTKEFPEADGDLFLSEKGGFCKFVFHPGKLDLEGAFHGGVKKGEVHFRDFDLAVQDASFHVDYDLSKNLLKLLNIEGAVFVGKDCQERYSLTGDHVVIDFQNGADFDFWISDKQRDLIRLVGKTKNHAEEKTTEVLLNRELTHLGDVHPELFKLVFDQNWEIKTFELDLNYRLETLLKDLQRISRSGAFFLSENLLEAFHEFKMAQGDFHLNVNYEPMIKQYEYLIEGKDVAVGNFTARLCELTGKKRGNQFLIEKCLFDGFKLVANLIYNPEHYWDIQSLGVEHKDVGSFEIQGRYLEDSYRLESKIQSLHLDLAGLHKLDFLKSQIPSQNLKGVFDTQGDFILSLNEKKGSIEASAKLEASLTNWSLGGFLFSDVKGALCQITPDKKLAVQNFKTCMQSTCGNNDLALFDMSFANYSFSKNLLQIEGLNFDLPAKFLKQTTKLLSGIFPEQFSERISKTLVESKKTGSLKGRIKAELSKQDLSLVLKLEDGTYSMNGFDYPLSQCVLEYNPDVFKMTAKYMHAMQPFWINLASSAPNFDQGKTIITKDPLKESKKQLVIDWENDPLYGLLIQKIEGSFLGMEPCLVLDHEHPVTPGKNHLSGTVKFNATEASHFFSQTLVDACTKWKMGNGYRLNGKFTLLKSPQKDGNLFFDGLFEGSHVEFNGYQFDSFSCYLEYEPTRTTFHDFTVKDPCGVLQTNRIDVYLTDDDYWFLSMPLLEVSYFRPSLLRVPGEPLPAKIKPLVVDHLELKDFQGYLADSTTFRGFGKFLFSNGSKKNTQNSIFQIPTDILSRIGLDPAVMTPVSGTVFFNVDDAKFHLTNFKDVQSEGKLSKFYLAEGNQYDSYIDFDGKLHVKVSMKQYTLLFKLAELFTVTIQGDLGNPVYKMHGKQKTKFTAAAK